MNDKQDTTLQNAWDAAKADLSCKCIALIAQLLCVSTVLDPRDMVKVSIIIEFIFY